MQAQRVFFSRHRGLIGAGNDIDINVAAPMDQLIHQRSTQNLLPARTERLARHDLGDVVLVCKFNDGR
jgi:hypothetical protein